MKNSATRFIVFILPALLLLMLSACETGAEKYAGTYTTHYIRYCTGAIPASSCNEEGTISVEVTKGGAANTVKLSVLDHEITLDGNGAGTYTSGDYSATLSFLSDSLYLSLHTHYADGDEYSDYAGKR